MKPIEVWSQHATAWTGSSMRWLHRWRGHADVRLGAMAGASLRKWLTSVVVAAALACVAAAAVHLLLLAALRSGAGLGWLAVAAVSAVAVVLLLIVVRDTVVALAAPQRRRAHMVGLLMSAAALLASVQACAAATVAMGSLAELWQAEQLYAWHVADSVPLLAIPEHLEWSRPAIATGPGDRAILVALTVALIVPLVRMVVAVYHLTGSALPNSGGSVRTPWRPSIPMLSKLRLPRTGIVFPLVVAAGFMWGGLGVRIADSSGFVFAGAIAAATLGTVLIAAVLSVGMGVLKVVWEPISDGPWMQLVLAAGLVWIDTPVRRVLLPVSEDLAAPWKFAVMLGLWAVLTVLLLPVWVDPQLPESLLALVLLLAFAGTAAPGTERVVAALDGTAGGFAFGPAVAAALSGLTGAYLAYLVSRAPARAANADGIHGSTDPRRELGGYAYVGLQVVIAAAGALLLLYGLGAAGVTTPSPIDAPRSLVAVAWHVVDSLPGDLPTTAAWRLGTDFTGPLAGAVVVMTECALIVVVAFPMIRATLRWAKDRAGRSAPERPLAEVPESILADLMTVRALLAEPSDNPQDAGLTVEERLGAAEADRRKLRELLGVESPVYWAADQAISSTTEAYGKLAQTQLSRWSPWPARQVSAVDAIAAIDAYAAAVERWQMGEDVVAEIESRLQNLESREDGVQLRESEVLTRERGVDARERMLTVREDATQTREQTVEVRAAAVEAREQETEARERAVDVRERSVATQEVDIDVREQSVHGREESTEARERAVEARERNAALREHDVDVLERTATTRAQIAEAREQSVESREHDNQIREASIEVRQRDVDLREQDIAAREQSVGTREQGIQTREQNADAREREIGAREENTKDREQIVQTRERKAAAREYEVSERQHWVEAREQNAEVREQSVVSRERNAAAREREIDVREREADARQTSAEVPEPTLMEEESLEHAEQA